MEISRQSGESLTLADIRQCVRNELQTRKYDGMYKDALYDNLCGQTLHGLINYYSSETGKTDLAKHRRGGVPVMDSVSTLMKSLYPIIMEEINAYFKFRTNDAI